MDNPSLSRKRRVDSWEEEDLTTSNVMERLENLSVVDKRRKIAPMRQARPIDFEYPSPVSLRHSPSKPDLTFDETCPADDERMVRERRSGDASAYESSCSDDFNLQTKHRHEDYAMSAYQIISHIVDSGYLVQGGWRMDEPSLVVEDGLKEFCNQLASRLPEVEPSNDVEIPLKTKRQLMAIGKRARLLDTTCRHLYETRRWSPDARLLHYSSSLAWTWNRENREFTFKGPIALVVSTYVPRMAMLQHPQMTLPPPPSTPLVRLTAYELNRVRKVTLDLPIPPKFNFKFNNGLLTFHTCGLNWKKIPRMVAKATSLSDLIQHDTGMQLDLSNQVALMVHGNNDENWADMYVTETEWSRWKESNELPGQVWQVKCRDVKVIEWIRQASHSAEEWVVWKRLSHFFEPPIWQGSTDVNYLLQACKLGFERCGEELQCICGYKTSLELNHQDCNII